jgi:hypothetical protein
MTLTEIVSLGPYTHTSERYQFSTVQYTIFCVRTVLLLGLGASNKETLEKGAKSEVELDQRQCTKQSQREQADALAREQFGVGSLR